MSFLDTNNVDVNVNIEQSILDGQVTREKLAEDVQKRIYEPDVVTAGGADLAEVGFWVDDNPNNEDRLYRFVSIAGATGKEIKIADSDDQIVGTSNLFDNVGFIGGYSIGDEEDNSKVIVSIVGVVPVKTNDSTIAAGDRVMSDDNGYAVKSSNNLGYRVLEVIEEGLLNIVVSPNTDMIQRIKTDIGNKQGKLTAGSNINIDENNVISATGGGNEFNHITQDITFEELPNGASISDGQYTITTSGGLEMPLQEGTIAVKYDKWATIINSGEVVDITNEATQEEYDNGSYAHLSQEYFNDLFNVQTAGGTNLAATNLSIFDNGIYLIHRNSKTKKYVKFAANGEVYELPETYSMFYKNDDNMVFVNGNNVLRFGEDSTDENSLARLKDVYDYALPKSQMPYLRYNFIGFLPVVERFGITNDQAYFKDNKLNFMLPIKTTTGYEKYSIEFDDFEIGKTYRLSFDWQSDVTIFANKYSWGFNFAEELAKETSMPVYEIQKNNDLQHFEVDITANQNFLYLQFLLSDISATGASGTININNLEISEVAE